MTSAHSKWRVTAAISLACYFVTHFLFAQSDANDSYHKSITVTVQDISFENLLNQLSRQTKLYFIYSANAVELRKPVTMHVQQQSVREVLETLGAMMNVSFRREGNYVVVKAINSQILTIPEPKIRSSQKEDVIESKPSFTASTFPRNSRAYFIPDQLSVPPELVRKNLLFCNPVNTSLDTFAVQRYPLRVTTPRPRRFGFTSVSFTLNDYSGGLEIHAGLPALYAVINGGLMRDGYFRNGYGIGTSIRIKPRITLTPIYTFASLKQQEDFVMDGSVSLIIKDGLKLTGRHHQAKFLIQIQAFENIRIHVGPSINFLKTSYMYPKDVLFYEIGAVTQPVYSGGNNGVSRVRIIRSFYTPPSDYSTFRSWIGFEAGISYSIKFSRP